MKSKRLTANTTIRYTWIQGQFHVIAKTGVTSLALPSPSSGYMNCPPLYITNDTASTITITCTGGFAQSGNSVNLVSTETGVFTVVPSGSGSHIWTVTKGVAVSGSDLAESARDAIGTALVAGSNITITPSDPADTITIATSAAVTLASTTPEVTASTSTGAVGDGTTSARANHVHGQGTHVHEKDTNGGHLCYYRTGLTGGGATALDGIAYADLADGNRAFVLVGNNPGVGYWYVFDIDNGGAESSPGIIAPDDAGVGIGRWVLAYPKTRSTDVTDWAEGVQDTVGAFIGTASTHLGLTATYSDGAGTLNLTNSVCKYVFTSLTGGGATALDSVDGDDLSDGDRALVVVGNAPGVVYLYVLDDDGAAGESSPGVIVPDTNPGTKNWVLATVSGNMMVYGTAANTVCVGNDARIPTTEENSALIAYHRTGLTGGTGADLDGIAYASCSDLMRARVTVGNNPGVIYDYVFDVDNGGAESSPDIIAPDDAGGSNGRWVLASVAGESIVYGTAASTACVGNDARLPTTAEKAALPWAEASSLTGGGVGALDALVTAGAATVGEEEVIVTLGAAPNQTFARYRFEKTGVAAESSPDVIRPDDFGTDGQGNWNLVLFSGTALPYGTAADTVCVGNDARLLTSDEHTALAGSVNWQDWAPTFAGVPAVDSTVARYQRIGNLVRGYIDIRGSDGDAWTPSTCTLPVAPSDVNARIPIQARQKVNAAAATDMIGYIDAETDLRIEFEGAASCTDAQAWHLYIWFEYEVAAA